MMIVKNTKNKVFFATVGVTVQQKFIKGEGQKA